MKKHLWIIAAIVLTVVLSCALAQAENNVTLTINGSSVSPRTVTVNAHVSMVIQAPGATAIRVLDPNRWNVDSSPSTQDCWDYYDRSWPLDYLEVRNRFDSQAQKVYAEARYDDYPDGTDFRQEDHSVWTVQSNEIVLQVSSNGETLGNPVVSLDDNSVAIGEWLTARVTVPLNANEWYWAELGQQDGNDPDNIQWRDHYDFNQANELSVPIVDYDAGTYWLYVYSSAAGYGNHGETRLSFQVAGNTSVSPVLLVNKTSAAVDEDIFLCAWAPGADNMRLEITRTGNPTWFDHRDWNGGYCRDSWSAGEPGTYHMVLKADGVVIGQQDLTFTVTAGNKLSRPDLSGIPGLVTEGNALSGTIGADPNAQWLDVNVEYIPDGGGNWLQIYHSNREKGDSDFNSLSLSASQISTPGKYKINVGVHALGYERNDSQMGFVVAPADSVGQFTLTVNGSTQDFDTWPSSKNLKVVAQAAEATAIRLLRDGDWWDTRDCRNGQVSWDLGFGDGDQVLIAQMTTEEPYWRADNFDWGSFSWEDLEWTDYSNAVKVHVTSQGDLQDPVVTLNPGSVITQGDILTVTVADQPNADWVWAELRILDDTDVNNPRWKGLDNSHFDSDGHTLTVTIPTFQLEPREYYLEVGVDAEGWNGHSVYLPLTVQEPAEQPEAVLYLTKESMQVGEGVRIYGWAPGCNHQLLEIRWDREANWQENRECWNQELVFWDWGCGNGGIYTFTMYYWMPGESEAHTLTAQLEVTSDGALADPVFTDVPGMLLADQDQHLYQGINGSFSAVDGAEWYNVSLEYIPADWELLVNEDRSADDPDATSLVFDSSLFTRLGTYKLGVGANAVGKDCGYQEIRIEVIDAATVTGSLDLRVNGNQDGSQVKIYLHQNFPVTVTAPAGVTGIRLRSSSQDWWDYRANTEGDNTQEWDWGFHNPGSVILIAQATTDPSITAWLADSSHDGMRDFDWGQVQWSMTAYMTVNVIKHGDLAAPEVTFPSGTSVERGDLLQLTIGTVQNAYSYGVQVRRADDDDWNWIIDLDYSFTETTTIELPTDVLEPGDYMLHIDPRCYGWHGDSRGYPITITAPESWSDEPFFHVSATEIWAREQITVSIYAPGANQVMLCEQGPDNDWQITDGDTLVDHFLLNWQKIYHLEAYAWYPGAADWQLIEAQNVNVKAHDTVSLEVTAPDSLKTSDPLDITLTCDFKGVGGFTEIYLRDWNGEYYDLENGEGTTVNGLYRITYHLPAGTLNIGPYFYTAYAYPNEVGYVMSIIEGCIDVSAGNLVATLTVDQNPLEIFEDLHLHLRAPGAAAVALYGTSNGMEWQYAVGDSLDWDDTMWWDADHFYYGYYTTQPVDPEADSFSWENVEWEGMSNSLVVTVNAPSHTLEELNVTPNAYTVKRGDPLILTIDNENPGLDVSYGAHLQPISENVDYVNGFTWFGPDPDQPNVIRIETLEVEPGSYQLQVSANAVSCHPVNTWLEVTVTDPDPGVQMTVYPNKNILTGNMVQVVGFADGATHLDLEVSSENGAWEPQPGYASCDVDGDLLNTEVFMGEHSDTVILELTATFEDGTTQTIRKTIPVAAPNGDVHPVIRLNRAWLVGQDLDFTVQVESEAQYVVFVQEPDAEEAMFATFVPPGHPVMRYQLSQSEYGFTAETTYEIRVRAAGSGYNGAEVSIHISPRTATTVLNLPAGLRTIEDEAFAGVAAEKIVVPSGVTTIGSKAFAGCPNLIELDLPQGITSFASDALQNSGPVFIYGPSGSYLESYASTVDNLYFIATD